MDAHSSSAVCRPPVRRSDRTLQLAIPWPVASGRNEQPHDPRREGNVAHLLKKARCHTQMIGSGIWLGLARETRKANGRTSTFPNR